MNIKMFYHSLLSDWNHGNAHFLRGVATELLKRGHHVDVYEQEDNWSLVNLSATASLSYFKEFYDYYPLLYPNFYELETFDPAEFLHDADLVIVHEWNEHELVKRIGDYRKQKKSFHLLFHDTHHRSITDQRSMENYDLSGYDGVLAYGKAIKDIYIDKGWTKQAWVWHEAADTNIFKPLKDIAKEGDLVWIGNWGEDERTEELKEYIINPASNLGLNAVFYGVRYPDHALEALSKSGITYNGWIANFKVPEVFAKYKLTVHVQRRPYTLALPGIPTIRPFEALACGIPLICSPWQDTENLFTPGEDYLVADSSAMMVKHMKFLLESPKKAQAMSLQGLETILQKHTCRHRVDELLNIYDHLKVKSQKSSRRRKIYRHFREA